MAAPPGLAPWVLQRPPRPPTHWGLALAPTAGLGRSLPPDLGCIPKQPDSLTAPRGATGSGPDGALTLPGAPFQGTWARSVAEDASPDYNSNGTAARFSSWAAPGSLAVTRGILRVVPPDLGSRSKRRALSLSVSHQYLALDGIYRPIGAAFPNNPTRRQRLVVRQGQGTTGLSPSLAPPSRGLGPGPPLRTLLQTTIRTPKAIDSHDGLFPVRSPLLYAAVHRQHWPCAKPSELKTFMHQEFHGIHLGSFGRLSNPHISKTKNFFFSQNSPPSLLALPRCTDNLGHVQNPTNSKLLCTKTFMVFIWGHLEAFPTLTSQK
ncbi:hypothetical protein DEO72_LG11g1241 [Vigna unguiculata]|uniref:Uncharacterized protein n=1 Tax=Vigna unguiculata TaxID=3917 RepID=A0A4D6NMM4_VIGUN|nr:hypothetical protein DEO72_LG11g1241 [Vigna unguiculata]